MSQVLTPLARNQAEADDSHNLSRKLFLNRIESGEEASSALQACDMSYIHRCGVCGAGERMIKMENVHMIICFWAST